MDSSTWTTIQEAFEKALALPDGEREAFVRTFSTAHPALGDHVVALLAADADPHTLLGRDSDTPGTPHGLPAVIRSMSDEAQHIQEWIKAPLADRYQLLGELGRGGMAVVFSGIERKHGRRVAIKVMRPSVAGRIDRRRFAVEIMMTAQLTHPHVVPLYDSGEADGLPYYVTAEVPGASLAARLREETPLTLDDVRAYSRGIAAALAYAHDRKILHRDVKPSNILLHDGLALLTDFGIAKALAFDDDALTQDGHALGTPRYMSPEQRRGDAIDTRTDLYAFGLVIREMIDHAWTGTGDRPGSLAAFFERALAVEPDRRFPSARALYQALEAALDGNTISEEGQSSSSVAVLPFDNDSPSGDDAYLSEGISEQLIHLLTPIDGLRVLARASSFGARSRTEDVAAIGTLLEVSHLVSGSVRRRGDRLRVTAELIETATMSTVWSERYDPQMEHVFELEDEIAAAVADALPLHLVRPRTAAAAPIPDVHAFDYYLRARHAIFSFTAESLRRAVDYLDQGLAILPENIPLLAAKGYTHWQFVNAGIDPDPEHLALAESIARQIDALEPDSHHADRLFGLVAIHQGQPVAAIERLERALAAHPTDTDAAFWLTLLLGFRGQPHRVEPHVEMLLATDPLNPLHHMLPGFLALMRGQTSFAPAAFRRALSMEPENPVLRLGCGQAEAMAGDFSAAVTTLKPLNDFPPGMLFAGLGRLLLRGLGEPVVGMTEDEAAAASQDLQWCWTAAQGHALAREHDEANRWLRRAVDIGFMNYPLIALHDPSFRGLRGDPDFEALLVEVEAAWATSLPLLLT